MNINPAQLQNLQAMMQAQQPKALAEVKAGKMTYDGRMVKPDRRKGIIRISKDSQGMMQFQFLDADTKNKIDGFYVFPGDCKFEKVKQSKDRVYLLEFYSTQQRHFYWMQEEDKEKDSENALKIHNVLNGIQTTSAAAAQQNPAPAQQQQQRQGPQLNSQAATQPGSAGGQQNFNNYFADPNIMNQFLQAMGQQNELLDRSPGLSSIVTSESMMKLLDDEEVRKALIEQLPEGQQNEENLRENLLSPQLRQAMHTLTQAIGSDQVSIILSSLGLDQSVLNNSKDGMEALINGLIKKYSKKE